MKLIQIATYKSRPEAEMAKSILKSHKIESIIKADDAGGAFPFPFANKFGVGLLVELKHVKLAKEVLGIKK